jgi:hypothetical protein
MHGAASSMCTSKEGTRSTQPPLSRMKWAHDTVPTGTEPQRIAHEPLCIGDALRDIDDVLDHIVDALK